MRARPRIRIIDMWLSMSMTNALWQPYALPKLVDWTRKAMEKVGRNTSAEVKT